jgi:hypothetical protein
MPRPIPCEHNPKKRCDDCQKAANAAKKRADRAADPEKSRAAVKKWRSDPENKEKRNAWERVRRAEDPQKHRDYHKQWRDENPDKMNTNATKNKEWRIQNPERSRASRRRLFAANPAKYRAKKWRQNGIVFRDGDTFESIIEAQEYKCQICLEELRGLPSWQVHLDHDHAISDRPNVRGVLCHKCNKTLGLIRDNIEHLENAITYLRSNLTTPESC